LSAARRELAPGSGLPRECRHDIGTQQEDRGREEEHHREADAKLRRLYDTIETVSPISPIR